MAKQPRAVPPLPAEHDPTAVLHGSWWTMQSRGAAFEKGEGLRAAAQLWRSGRRRPRLGQIWGRRCGPSDDCASA
eukprot:2584158-Pyramimonas_sp.AAC.1